MPSCNVQVFNATENVIAKATVLHSASFPTSSSDLQQLGVVTDLPPKTPSRTLVATQEDFSGDYWAGAVQFVGDPNTYFFFNDLVPICECNVPANGSGSMVCQGTTNDYNLQINTYHNSNWTDGDGYCSEELDTQEQMKKDDELAEEIVELILEILGG